MDGGRGADEGVGRVSVFVWDGAEGVRGEGCGVDGVGEGVA